MSAEGTLDQFVVEINAESTRIAEVLQAMIDQDLTSAEVTSKLQPLIDNLRELGTNPPA